jgi:arylsulfatase A-like enzyme
VAIGDEARPVVAAPALEEIAKVTAQPGDDGAVRVSLPDLGSARRDPSTLFVDARLDLEDPPEDVIQLGSLIVHFEPLGEWSLEPDPTAPGRNRLVVPARAIEGVAKMDVRIRALRPSPARLESRARDYPAGSRLLLGYGLAYAEGITAPRPVALTATLICRDRTRVLHRDTLGSDGGGPLGWRGASIALPFREGPCRLRLEAHGPRKLRDRVVWAVPQLLVPIERGAGVDERNLVLISLDTLRADHLSGYGYERPTSPTIDRELIARGTTFADVSTTFPLTNIAHLSLFTALYPDAQPPHQQIATTTPLETLAERLGTAGFETAALTEDALLTGGSGLWSGFDSWVEMSLGADDRGEKIFADGLRFLRRNRDGKFFLFLHTYKVHEPYESSPEYRELFRSGAGPRSSVPASMHATVDAYDRAIREADDLVGRFLWHLAALGLAERTVVAVVSDHGEAFLEHGVKGHGLGGGQEQLRIPWILRGPGVPAGRRITTPVSLVDVAPTLLGLLGGEPIDGAQGRDLSATLASASAPDERPLYFSWMGNTARGVRLGRWKHVEHAGTTALYDLEEDPLERNPLEPRARERDLLAAQMAADRERQRRYGAGTREAPSVRPAVRKALRALGYAQ